MNIFRPYHIALVASGCSALLANVILVAAHQQQALVSYLALYIIPGFLFALAMVLVNAYMKQSVSLTNAIAWCIASAMSYDAAVQSTLWMVRNHSAIDPLFVGGVIGGILMLLSYHVTIYSLKGSNILVLVLLSGILGLSGHIGGGSLVFLFLIWQMGMATVLTLMQEGILVMKVQRPQTQN